jgi:hypothetical protein
LNKTTEGFPSRTLASFHSFKIQNPKFKILFPPFPPFAPVQILSLIFDFLLPPEAILSHFISIPRRWRQVGAARPTTPYPVGRIRPGPPTSPSPAGGYSSAFHSHRTPLATSGRGEPTTPYRLRPLLSAFQPFSLSAFQPFSLSAFQLFSFYPMSSSSPGTLTQCPF